MGRLENKFKVQSSMFNVTPESGTLNFEPGTLNRHARIARLRPYIAVAALISLFAAGCPSLQPTPDNTRYFSLTPQMEARADANAAGLDQLFLGVGPVRLPGYLDREELVTRVGHNRFDVAQNDRWVEPLEDNFSRVLAQDLYALLKTERIVRYPWPSSRGITHQVEIEVIRFEPIAGEDAQLTAQWTLTESRTRQPLAIKNSSFRRPVKQRSKEAAVDALSELLADFSREIADTVRTVAVAEKPQAVK